MLNFALKSHCPILLLDIHQTRLLNTPLRFGLNSEDLFIPQSHTIYPIIHKLYGCAIIDWWSFSHLGWVWNHGVEWLIYVTPRLLGHQTSAPSFYSCPCVWFSFISFLGSCNCFHLIPMVSALFLACTWFLFSSPLWCECVLCVSVYSLYLFQFHLAGLHVLNPVPCHVVEGMAGDCKAVNSLIPLRGARTSAVHLVYVLQACVFLRHGLFMSWDSVNKFVFCFLYLGPLQRLCFFPCPHAPWQFIDNVFISFDLRLKCDIISFVQFQSYILSPASPSGQWYCLRRYRVGL